jgi:hypothetical protein
MGLIATRFMQSRNGNFFLTVFKMTHESTMGYFVPEIFLIGECSPESGNQNYLSAGSGFPISCHFGTG